MTYIAPPTAASDVHVITGSRISWTTSDVDLLTYTTDRAGYWWAGTAATVFSGSGNQTFKLWVAGSVVDSEQNNVRTRLLLSGPTFLAAGTIIKLTGVATGSGNQDETVTKLVAIFIPTTGFIH